ncbi:alpha/beta hydrolase [Vibrio sp. ZSDE26]|uniref:Alpha/beta hydrolase n=1 Tax=Vibrio amylolyticus TaxID=2847292 RepID=A0A9X1XLU7_9VIBR|nr:alpha/beta hydrolase [Vibrio amylolyticus]MCK6264585.1 alpha/beta hydrolase [Vibrio amylolyticus]
MKMALNILLISFFGLAAGLLSLYFFQDKLIYPEPKPPLEVSLPEHASLVNLGLSDGFLLMPKLRESQQVPLMIFTHGNAELASHWLNSFNTIIENNIAVLIVEYPGYGGSVEKTNFRTINRTMLNAFDLVSNLPEIDKNKIIAYGRSIGGGAAALLAKQRPLSALCLESTFSSLPKLVSDKGLPGFLVSDRYDNEEIIKQLDIPIFIYHGVNDAIIPISHAESLVNSSENITFYTENCGHNNCPRKWDELLAFLKLNDLD